MTRNFTSTAVGVRHQLTAAVLAVLMSALGWFVRSEAAHDHLHFHPVAKSSFAVSGGVVAHVITKTPRWLKLGPVPKDASAPEPAGSHRHRSLAFDSLAAGQWCSLFTPAALPVLDLPVVAGPVPHRLVALLSPHWTLLPGRAPPACA
ncbi:MAG: hypothetical protein B9S33_08015 [Pedosphaera sp. Tous-C6FEB]|nr:MAG: hypothetical protein B9S33_08015 [Pedosphaera sp. Tous-C6FEB]